MAGGRRAAGLALGWGCCLLLCCGEWRRARWGRAVPGRAVPIRAAGGRAHLRARRRGALRGGRAGAALRGGGCSRRRGGARGLAVPGQGCPFPRAAVAPRSAGLQRNTAGVGRLASALPGPFLTPRCALRGVAAGAVCPAEPPRGQPRQPAELTPSGCCLA